MDAFDPYFTWLGIRPKDQPPNHYRLLGLEPLEDDPETIDNAADRQMAFVRAFQTGPHADASQKILNEIAAARLCLLDSAKKADYDRDLQARQAASIVPVRARPVAVVPLPSAQPLRPQPVEARPIIDVRPRELTTTADRLGHQRAWRVPAAMATMAAAALGVVIAYHLFSGKKSDDSTDRPTRPRDARLLTQSPATASPSPDESGSLPIEPTTRPVDRSPLVATGEIDLLARVDPQSDAVAGQWKQEGRSLVSPAGVIGARLQIPGEAPAEYTLTAVAERLEGNSHLAIGLVAGGRQVELAVDWDPGDRRGFESGLYIGDGSTPVKRSGRLMREGVPSTIVCQIDATRILVTVDGTTIVDYTGDFARLGLTGQWAVRDPRVLFVGSTNTSYRFSRLGLQTGAGPPPVNEPEISETSDLVDGIDLEGNAIAGTWRRDGRGFLSDASVPLARLQIPANVPEYYEATLVVEQLNGADYLLVGLFADGRQIGTYLDYSHDGVYDSGLYTGPRSGANVFRGRLFKPGVPSTIRFTIGKEQFRVIVDGRTIVDRNVGVQGLGLHDNWAIPSSRALLIGSFRTQYRITRFEIRPVSADPKR